MLISPADTSYVKPLGRTTPIEKGLWLCWSGSGAEFTFTGAKCRITILGDDQSKAPETPENHARLAIEINGERVVSQQIADKVNTFAFEHSENRDWHVRIIKLSESAMATCVLSQIECDGTPAPTQKKLHAMEIVGDSITCGYGIDDPVAEHPFHTATEDVTQAYAYLAAQELNADYAIVSLSGWGIISGYTGNGERSGDQLLPPYYDKAGYCHQTFEGMKPQQLSWDFSRFTPEVVIVNLGTNDDSFTGEDEERQSEYCREYQLFLKKIRRLNPSASILCTLGMMGDRLYPQVAKAVAQYTAETGDTNVDCLHFTPQTAEDGYSSDWHPSKLTQRRAGAALADKLKNWLGW
ncbi:MAG: GDSL family lipase [Clostridiales bacterium]|nr:GDSL family lipase [Clostridiales bacterium]